MSREHYALSAQSLPELVTQLNFILSRIQDRLDKIEGVRGTSTIKDGMSISTDGILHGVNTENELS